MNNKKISCIIVDDEPLAREALKMVLQEFDDFEIIAECANGFEAVKAVREKKPHVLFLDIQMPKLSGFDVLDVLGDEAPPTVFVTAYDSYAIRAFEEHALDYLLKPVQKERLKKTLHRFKQNRQVYHAERPLLDDLQKHDRPINRILVREGSNITIIPVDDIVYIEAQGDYIRILTGQTTYLKHEKISVLEKKLDESRFVRIHRSYLLNIAVLRKIESSTKDSWIALLVNGEKIPISRSGYRKLRKILGE